jgi:dolichol-phosphate mannosyltransferase
VTVVVPTLNEAARLGPCLTGLARQGPPLVEVIVVDSGSDDGTVELVADMARRDARFRVERDPPLPTGWIGKVWALQHGLSVARGEWLLGIDADTEPNDGMVAGVVAAARERGLDLVSCSPRFAGQTAAERWLQPALLASLVYRTGAPGRTVPPSRLLANGQCFLVRRASLLAHGGYEPAKDSFADDVRLARHYAEHGVACAFLDGRLLYRVRSYHSAGEMWREWGRSVDLADATPRWQHRIDLAALVFAQALPAPAFVAGLVWREWPLVIINALLLSIRFSVLAAIAPSYERRGLPFFMSWALDPVAVFRVVLSTFRRPVSWRGRSYDAERFAATPAGAAGEALHPSVLATGTPSDDSSGP